MSAGEQSKLCGEDDKADEVYENHQYHYGFIHRWCGQSSAGCLCLGCLCAYIVWQVGSCGSRTRRPGGRVCVDHRAPNILLDLFPCK